MTDNPAINRAVRLHSADVDNRAWEAAVWQRQLQLTSGVHDERSLAAATGVPELLELPAVAILRLQTLARSEGYPDTRWEAEDLQALGDRNLVRAYSHWASLREVHPRAEVNAEHVRPVLEERQEGTSTQLDSVQASARAAAAGRSIEVVTAMVAGLLGRPSVRPPVEAVAILGANSVVEHLRHLARTGRLLAGPENVEILVRPRPAAAGGAAMPPGAPAYVDTLASAPVLHGRHARRDGFGAKGPVVPAL